MGDYLIVAGRGLGLGLAGLSTSHVFKYGGHDFPGKSPYRGIASRPNSRVLCVCVGGGGGGEGKGEGSQHTLTSKKQIY